MESEISVCVRNWELKTQVLKPKFENPNSRLLSQRAEKKVQTPGLTAWPCRKPKTKNQQLKYEVNLRFETRDFKSRVGS